MITKESKNQVIERLKGHLSKAQAVYLTNVVGLEANDVVKLRKDIRDANGALVVARNSLLQKASEGSPQADLLKDLKGTNAVAFAFADAPAVAKVLYDARKTLELVSLNGGYLGEQALEGKEIEALAKLPSRDEMLATLLATMNAPISSFVRVFDQIRQGREEGSVEEEVASP